MAVGNPKNAAALDSKLGELSKDVHQTFRRWRQLNTEIDLISDAQLTAAGYTAGEITAIRAACDRMVQLANIYSGAASLASASDFQPDLRPFWGIIGDD